MVFDKFIDRQDELERIIIDRQDELERINPNLSLDRLSRHLLSFVGSSAIFRCWQKSG